MGSRLWGINTNSSSSSFLTFTVEYDRTFPILFPFSVAVFMNEREIFLAALQIGNDGERRAFLDSIFQSGDQARNRINQLLSAHSQPNPAFDRVAEYIAKQAFETSETFSEGTGENHKADLSSPGLLRQAIGLIFDQSPAAKNSQSSAGVPAGTRLDRYEIIKRIGSGGMGEVYLARDAKLERQVAVKLLAPHRTNDIHWLNQFRREARTVGGLNHPNILTIHEIGESGGVHFLVTEFVDGLTLRQIETAARPSLENAVDYAIQAASALVAAHAAQIIHRDLKPENLMIRSDGILKILDFGLAKQVALDNLSVQGPEYQSDPGVVIGTIHYMSPEQARGKLLDQRTDIFSLGIVLFELLNGSLPFQGETTTDVLAAILERDPQPLASQNIPEVLQKIVSKCLHKNPSLRFSTARELLSELKNCAKQIGNQPLSGSTAKSDLSRAQGNPSPDDIPTVRYTRSGDVNIAYQVLGDGAIDLVFVMGWVSHLEMFWQEPSFARFLKRLSQFSRLILFDKRGTGLSDKVPNEQLPTLEQRMDDVRAVMDAAGSQRAVLCGISEGGPMCTLFAATYPEKTLALTMIGSYARRLWAPDYPWGPSEEHREHFFDEIRRDWGGPVGIEARAPSKAHDPAFRNWWAAYLRMGASPGAALALTKMNAQIDIRPILTTVQVPTLVIHRTDDHCLLVEEGRFLAEQIPGAKFVELPGPDHLPFVGDQDSILDEIEEFLTGVRHRPLADRVLATVLFLLPDKNFDPVSQIAFGETYQRFQSHVVRETQLFNGRNLVSQNHAMVMTFDGPTRAVRAGLAIGDTAKRLGIRLRVGVHTGECELVNGEASGAAVDMAEWVAQNCPTGNVLVSNTVKDLVAGSGLTFAAATSTLKTPNQALPISLFVAVR